jgi:Trypsin-like peptidase domain
MERNIRSSYCFRFPTHSGSGIAVHRYRDASGEPTDVILVATAAHVVDSLASFYVMDYRQIKYTQTTTLVMDRGHDIAIVRVAGVPPSHPIADALQQQRKPLAPGTPLYVVGWPLAMDMHSVTSGVVRSGAWASNGSITQMLVDASIFGGNSGGGIFTSADNQLVGLVSWGLTGSETFNGAVPGWQVAESLAMVLGMTSSAELPALAPVSCHDRNSYFLGAVTYPELPQWMAVDVPDHPMLAHYGVLGYNILTMLPGTAAAYHFSGLDTIWAMSPGFEAPMDSSKWIMLTEEVGIDMALSRIAALYRTRSYNMRKTFAGSALRGPASRSKVPPPVKDLDPFLPPTLSVHFICSETTTKVLRVETAELEKRYEYIQREGSDGSAFDYQVVSMPTLMQVVRENAGQAKADLVPILKNTLVSTSPTEDTQTKQQDLRLRGPLAVV